MGSVFHAVCEHALRCACLKDKGHIRSLFCGIPDLLDIDRCIASVRFEICRDHIFHDDDVLIG